jgi:hypothetical protein
MSILLAWDYQRTLELALKLQPKTREVVCVAGTGLEEQPWNNEARKVLERYAARVRTRWLDKLPLQGVLDEVARLPLDSVVLYMRTAYDGKGNVEVAVEDSGPGIPPDRLHDSSTPSLQRRRTKWVWGYQLSDRSWKLTADESGQKTTLAAERASDSRCL